MDHTWHPTQANTPCFNPSQWRLVLDLEGMEGRVDLAALLTPGPGLEPMTARSEVQRPNRCTTETPRCTHQMQKSTTNKMSEEIYEADLKTLELMRSITPPENRNVPTQVNYFKHNFCLATDQYSNSLSKLCVANKIYKSFWHFLFAHILIIMLGISKCN